jgi:hypothetical protein
MNDAIQFSREDIQFAGYATNYGFNNISIDKEDQNGLKYREYNLLPKQSLVSKCSMAASNIVREINLRLYEDETIGIDFAQADRTLLYNSHINNAVMTNAVNYMVLRNAVEEELARSRSSIYQELQSLVKRKNIGAISNAEFEENENEIEEHDI